MPKLNARKKIGLIVNPFAGIGGRVGLKGSDGRDTVKKAIELGGVSFAPERAIAALGRLSSLREEVELYTSPHEMGEDEARQIGFDPLVVGRISSGETTAEDTKNAALSMAERGVELLVFAGGDGTARDICEAIGERIPVLGIPAGVKIHSSVFAISPERAGDLVRSFMTVRVPLHLMEVMDIDERLYRQGQVSARLYGYLKVPFERSLVQGPKVRSSSSGDKVWEIARFIVDDMREDHYYILGTGTTIRAIGDLLGINKTLLGVDLVHRGEFVAKDSNEKELLDLIVGTKTKIIVTVIGGQGYILGRGNQQISPEVVRYVGKGNLIVAATQHKLISLPGPLLVDTGDRELDQSLAGYMRVITGYNEECVWKVEH